MSASPKFRKRALVLPFGSVRGKFFRILDSMRSSINEAYLVPKTVMVSAYYSEKLTKRRKVSTFTVI